MVRPFSREHMENEFIIGIHPILEKLKASPEAISVILLARGPLRPTLKSLESEAQKLQIKIQFMDAKELDYLALGQSHQGALARVRPYSYLPLSELERT